MSDHSDWFNQAERNGWNMPKKTLRHRLPLVRHVWTMWNAYKIEQWYGAVPGFRTGYDEWVLYGVWHNLKAEGRQP